MRQSDIYVRLRAVIEAYRGTKRFTGTNRPKFISSMRDEDGIFSHDTLTSMNIKYAKETEVSTTHRVQVSDGLNPVYLKYERDDITGRELVTFISTQLNGSEGKYKPETLNIALF